MIATNWPLTYAVALLAVCLIAYDIYIEYRSRNHD